MELFSVEGTELENINGISIQVETKTQKPKKCQCERYMTGIAPNEDWQVCAIEPTGM